MIYIAVLQNLYLFILFGVIYTPFIFGGPSIGLLIYLIIAFFIDYGGVKNVN